MEEAWASSLRWQLKFLDQKHRNSEAKTLILAGIQERENKLVQNLSYAMNDIYNLASKEELQEAQESAQMMAADAFSARYRKFLKKQGEGSKGPKKLLPRPHPQRRRRQPKRRTKTMTVRLHPRPPKVKALPKGKIKKCKGKKKK